MSAVLVKDYLDDDSGWDLESADYIALRIVRDFGYRHIDAHTPNPSTEYRLTDDLYEDCKNGVQIYYDDVQNEHYAGTDTVKVYLKEFVW